MKANFSARKAGENSLSGETNPIGKRRKNEMQKLVLLN